MKKPTILAVDDDTIILDTYEAIIEDTYNLHLVPSAQEALDFLNSHRRVDLILLDIMMPEIDGYETCRQIRENPLFSDVKVLLVSSKMMLEDRLRGYQVGADDYITKPFEAGELLAKIEVFLRLKNAEQISRIKTNIIDLLNHETRTPLTGIFGCVELLRESPNLTNQERYFVNQIQEYGDALLRTCEKITLLGDLKSGTIRLNETTFPLGIILSECQRNLKRKLNDKQLSFQTQVEDDLCIFGDAKLLGIVVDSLLDNAAKFARERSAVVVTAKTMREYARIEVSNEGEKIAPELQEDIFGELFVKDLGHHHEGQGLSLAIARRIIEAHDGTLSVSNHSNGPVFTIDIKLQHDVSS
jgi:two-component system sensor histidine kinase/response regulator